MSSNSMVTLKGVCHRTSINGKEDLLAIITALDNVMREINCNGTGDSGHKGYFRKTMPCKSTI